MSAARAAFLLALVAAPAAAQQGLADPTRPPNAASFAAVEAAPAAGPQLQSVLLSPGRKLAVIDGVTVALGGKVGDATLVRIGETEAVLKGGDGMTILKLYPGIEKKAAHKARVRAAAPTSAATGETKR